jgi:hypothetical protein
VKSEFKEARFAVRINFVVFFFIFFLALLVVFVFVFVADLLLFLLRNNIFNSEGWDNLKHFGRKEMSACSSGVMCGAKKE